MFTSKPCGNSWVRHISMDMLYQFDLIYSSLYNYNDIRRIIQLPGISNILTFKYTTLTLLHA